MGLFGWVSRAGKTIFHTLKKKSERVAEDGTSFRDAKRGRGELVTKRSIAITCMGLFFVGCRDKASDTSRKVAKVSDSALTKAPVGLSRDMEKLFASRTALQVNQFGDIKFSNGQLVAADNGMKNIEQIVGLLKNATDRIEGVEKGISRIEKTVQLLVGQSGMDDAKLDENLVLPVATMGQARELIQNLGEEPSAAILAEAIATMDEWMINIAEEKRFIDFKQEQILRLREKVKSEVGNHQEAALKAKTGAEASKELAEAGRILSMFPMSDEASIIEEAKKLASHQSEIANRLEVIRRQRYNRWAVEQIEKALDFYNANVSKYNPLSDNSILIGDLVNNIGEVDPILLEPVVLDLYNYVIDRTKGSISEKNKLELAKRLTDPLNQRKDLGDF